MVYDPVTEKRTVTIPDVIEFVDSDQLKQSVVISENGKHTVIVPRQILFEDEDGRDLSFRRINNAAPQSYETVVKIPYFIKL